MKKILVTTVLSLSMVLGFSAFALGADAIPTTPPDDLEYTQGSEEINDTKALDDKTYDNEINNVNQSGKGVGGDDPSTFTIQNVKGQRTHGEYQNNTNSCASCHQTHTAAAENLLFKNGVYETCSACHDGTLGVLNVFEGSTAGTFGGTTTGNASMHMPQGAMKVKAAPGGNRNAEDSDANWGAEFTCASCHSPHGSFSDRLLNFNPNGVGTTDMYKSPRVTDPKTGDYEKSGGLQVTNAPIVASSPAETTVPYVLDPETQKYVAAPAPATHPEFVVVRTTEKLAGISNAETPVIVLMKRVATAQKGADNTSGTSDDSTKYTYTRDVNPWINNHAGGSRATWTQFMGADGKMAYDSKDVNLSLGYAKPNVTGSKDFAADDASFTKFMALKTATISRATVVKFDFLAEKDVNGKWVDSNGAVIDTKVAGWENKLVYKDQGTFNNLPVRQVDISSYDNSGYALQISTFCAACHTDYLATAGKETGVWSKAFRHNTIGDSYTCLKCHFAHGTDVNVMLDADDNSVDTLVAKGMDPGVANEYMLDKNPSSALKRYTNMSVCWKCHTSSHSESFINNEWFSGEVDSSVKGSTEFGTAGTNVPAGWVDPNQSLLPYYSDGHLGDGTQVNPYAPVNPEGNPSNPE